jgi:hypothetical protein
LSKNALVCPEVVKKEFFEIGHSVLLFEIIGNEIAERIFVCQFGRQTFLQNIRDFAWLTNKPVVLFSPDFFESKIHVEQVFAKIVVIFGKTNRVAKLNLLRKIKFFLVLHKHAKIVIVVANLSQLRANRLIFSEIVSFKFAFVLRTLTVDWNFKRNNAKFIFSVFFEQLSRDFNELRTKVIAK